jgi:hypothetical protein
VFGDLFVLMISLLLIFPMFLPSAVQFAQSLCIDGRYKVMPILMAVLELTHENSLF